MHFLQLHSLSKRGVNSLVIIVVAGLFQKLVFRIVLETLQSTLFLVDLWLEENNKKLKEVFVENSNF